MQNITFRLHISLQTFLCLRNFSDIASSVEGIWQCKYMIAESYGNGYFEIEQKNIISQDAIRALSHFCA